jgi:hypothetical protein
MKNCILYIPYKRKQKSKKENTTQQVVSGSGMEGRIIHLRWQMSQVSSGYAGLCNEDIALRQAFQIVRPDSVVKRENERNQTPIGTADEKPMTNAHESCSSS